MFARKLLRDRDCERHYVRLGNGMVDDAAREREHPAARECVPVDRREGLRTEAILFGAHLQHVDRIVTGQLDHDANLRWGWLGGNGP